MPQTRYADVFWQAFPPLAGLDQDNYVVGPSGDSAATEPGRFGRRRDQEGQLGVRIRRGSRGETEARRFRHHVQTAEAPPVHGTAGLAPHIRALLPIRSGLTRKGREAGVRWRTLGRHSLSDNQ
jgi:hypothetical protein